MNKKERLKILLQIEELEDKIKKHSRFVQDETTLWLSKQRDLLKQKLKGQ